ncbi:MAG: L-carnitine dehydratase/bile acid-inducible protein [Thermoleophilia bacterium]|nr:L-carnitine dehydratase/bile acid-inducible protein [Thermoleophilia bacterium]
MPDDSATHPPAHRPLEGITVLDVSRYLPGPFCSLNLAWLGASVTVVEQPPHGDPLRTLPPVGDDGLSLAYRSLRRDMDVELLDLADGDGLARFLELADAADVFVESFRPGVTTRLGIGPEQLRARNARLVYCSLSGYGQTGPWAQAPGHDIGYESVAGLLEQTGTREEIAMPPVPLADLAGGQSAATAICAALVRRATSGDGCVLDISLTESALALQAMHLPGAELAPANERARGLLTGGFACYRPYRCADGEWISIGPIEPKFFVALCTAIERPELAELQYSPSDQAHLRTELETVFAARDAAAWEQVLVGDAGGDACVVRVLHPSQVASHPQLVARGAVLPLPGSDIAHMPASPYVVDGVRSDRSTVST